MMTSHNRTRPGTPYKRTRRLSLFTTVAIIGCASGESLPGDTGNATGTGGAPSGGAFSSGGSASDSGGATSSGGAVGSGGASAATGGTSAGGMTAAGGGDSAGGMPAAGGGDSAGGMGSGGEPAEPCVVPNEEVCGTGSIPSLHCGLTYELWSDNGSACMTNTAEGFLAEWTGNNYIARVGLRPGEDEDETVIDPVVTYSATYNTNGTSYLTVYGWTTDPLVEFYILEAHDPTYRPPGNGPDVTSYPDIQADGGTYQVRRSQRTNQPSIIGTASFPQYWSLRTQNRTSGTIHVADHFAAWEKAGLEMGDIYEVSMAVEGFGSSGKADVKVSFE